MKIQKLSEQIILFTDDLHRHENVVVIWTSEGPVIVDAFGSSDQFCEVQKYLAEKGYSKPILQIFTHWHASHTLGNQMLDDVRILAHRCTLDYMERFLYKHVQERLVPERLIPKETRIFTPTEVFDVKRSLNIGDTRIVLIHAPGHSVDSTFVVLPDQQILLAGDNLLGPEAEFLFPPILPEEETGGLEDLAQVYRQIRHVAPKTVIPGHGWILPMDEMLSLNEHRYKVILKRTMEIVNRSLPCLINLESPYEEQIIRAWLSQANTCITMPEQETLKENIGKVLRLFTQTFDRLVINGK